MDIVYVFFRGHEVNQKCIDPQLNYVTEAIILQ
jgi:hypothetical protein